MTLGLILKQTGRNPTLATLASRKKRSNAMIPIRNIARGSYRIKNGTNDFHVELFQDFEGLYRWSITGRLSTIGRGFDTKQEAIKFLVEDLKGKVNEPQT